LRLIADSHDGHLVLEGVVPAFAEPFAQGLGKRLIDGQAGAYVAHLVWIGQALIFFNAALARSDT
jgi:hypothetical protein